MLSNPSECAFIKVGAALARRLVSFTRNNKVRGAPAMKRTRRMFLQVTHREISISLTQTIVDGSAASEGSRSGAAHQAEEAKPVAPATCPDCGAAWLSDLAEVLSNFRFPLELLRAALHDRSIHSFWLADGQFLVCAQSLKTVTETHP